MQRKIFCKTIKDRDEVLKEITLSKASCRRTAIRNLYGIVLLAMYCIFFHTYGIRDLTLMNIFLVVAGIGLGGMISVDIDYRICCRLERSVIVEE